VLRVVEARTGVSVDDGGLSGKLGKPSRSSYDVYDDYDNLPPNLPRSEPRPESPQGQWWDGIELLLFLAFAGLLALRRIVAEEKRLATAREKATPAALRWESFENVWPPEEPD
jgi:hypothetical protein